MSTSPQPPRAVRMYPRVPVALPIEIEAGKSVMMCETVNLSAGGLLIACRRSLPGTAAFKVRINLPTGDSIHAPVQVVHQASRNMGVQFVELPSDARATLSAFADRMLSFKRRGERLTRRLHVTVSRMGQRREDAEEIAETVVISRHGGLLVCRAHFAVGERIFVYWPEKKRGAPARVVALQTSGKAGIVELGFEFEGAEDFWDAEFNHSAGLC